MLFVVLRDFSNAGSIRFLLYNDILTVRVDSFYLFVVKNSRSKLFRPFGLRDFILHSNRLQYVRGLKRRRRESGGSKTLLHIKSLTEFKLHTPTLTKQGVSRQFFFFFSEERVTSKSRLEIGFDDYIRFDVFRSSR
jgi:hypothetical protein